MAEILIYNATHWMDILSQEQWDEHRAKDPHWDEMYACRYQQGHVVEVRPDGFWSSTGKYPRLDKFRVIIVPGVTVDQVQHLLAEGVNTRRAYRVTAGVGVSVLTVQNIQNLKIQSERA